MSTQTAADLPQPGQRIVIIGNSGSGKTTLAAALARQFEYPHHEMDALHWGPGWQLPTIEGFREKLAAALAGDGWVADGNYSRGRDIAWGRADTIIWLDYSLPLLVWRLVKRSCHRIITREQLWQGNQETWRGVLFSRDSLILYAIRVHKRRRQAFVRAFHQPEYAHLTVIHLRSPRQTALWLAAVVGSQQSTFNS